MIVIACDVCRKNTNLTSSIVLMTTKYKLDKEKKRESVISVTMGTELIPNSLNTSASNEEIVTIHVCNECRAVEQNKLLTNAASIEKEKV